MKTRLILKGSLSEIINKLKELQENKKYVREV
jgi:hypothetical protein|nr:MAG TPA: cell division factor [Caudoviricetes sp.]